MLNKKGSFGLPFFHFTDGFLIQNRKFFIEILITVG